MTWVKLQGGRTSRVRMLLLNEPVRVASASLLARPGLLQRMRLVATWFRVGGWKWVVAAYGLKVGLVACWLWLAKT